MTDQATSGEGQTGGELGVGDTMTTKDLTPMHVMFQARPDLGLTVKTTELEDGLTEWRFDGPRHYLEEFLEVLGDIAAHSRNKEISGSGMKGNG